MQTTERKFDLVSMGDLMIDFSCVGKSKAGRLLYERNPGGGPMNVAAQLSRLGGKAGIISSVGEDEHGEYLYHLAQDDLGFDVTNLQYTSQVGTRCLFVYFDENNDRSFTNYKSPRSDLMIDGDRLDMEQIRSCKVFNYTPLAFEFAYPIAEATQKILKVVKENGIMISFDPNYRFPYTDQKALEMAIDAIKSAQILKLTLQELRYFLGEEDIYTATEKLLDGNARIVAVTMGPNGCFLRNRRGLVYRPTYDVPVLDTTGAGDSFMGSMIYAVTRPGVDIDTLGEKELTEIADFCNACSSGSTMQRGSLLVMPNREKVKKIQDDVPFRNTTLEGALRQGI